MALPEECPLCHCGTERQSVVTAHVFGNKSNQNRSFFHCEKCDVRYQYPSLSPDEEAKFYAHEFESFMAGRSGEEGGWHRPEKHIAANELMRQRRMAYIEPHLNGPAHILEIGCSSGFMLYPLQEASHTCVWIEPSGIFSEFLKHRDIDVYDSIGQLHVFKPEERFDLIIHFFVLEHIADPILFLQMQLESLNPGGKIIFEIPNVADPLYTVFDIPAFERFYWSVAHPWYFSENSLNYLLDKLGKPYQIVRDQRYDLSNHLIWARDGAPGGMGRFSEVFGQEMDVAYKQALIKSGNCDTLIGIITKN